MSRTLLRYTWLLKAAALYRVLLVLAIISLGKYIVVSWQQLVFPVDLLHESPVWNTALLMHKGLNIYSAKIYDSPPFNLNIYTPLYFATVSSMPGFSTMSLTIGRAVSLLFTIGALSLLIFTFESKGRMIWGLIGIGWLALFEPVLTNGAIFRMDFMALFFSACAIASIRKQPVTDSSTILSAVFSFLTLMSKQSYVAAPLSCFIYLFLKNRRQAFRFATVAAFLLGISVYLLDRWSDGGFIWSTLIATKNPLSLELFVANLEKMATPAFITLLGLSALTFYWVVQRRRKDVEGTHPGLLNAIYFLTAWLWLFASIGKLGADINYFIEPLYASVWLLFTSVDHEDGRWVDSKAWRFALAILVVSFAWTGFAARHEPGYVLAPFEHHPDRFQKIKAEIQGLKTSERPKVLNIVEPHHALSVGWDLYLNDPYLYSILWHAGTLSNRALLETIDRRFFDVIVLAKGSHRESFSDPSLHALYKRIFDGYEVKTEATFAYLVSRR